MKAFLCLRFVLLVFFGVFLTSAVNSQGMKKPDPVKNATFDLLMGTWVADPYEMMGEKWNETANHYIKFGQYMVVDITGSGDKGNSYNGMVFVKPGLGDSWTGYSFDDWGTVTIFTGTASGNKISMTGKSDMGTETRNIEINGNTMVHKVSMTMKGPDGKDMNFNQTITYHKQ